MSEESGGWRGRASGPKPPWWPEGRAWPPEGPGPWGRGGWGARSWSGERGAFPRRGAFVWRIGCLFLLAILVAGALGTVGIRAVATALGLVPGSDADRIIAILGLGLAIAVLLTIGRALRRFAAPVGELVEAARRVEAGEYEARVPERGSRDLRTLSRAFNAMSARLGATEAQRRSFLADVTHELRTPLTVIQGRVEAVLDGIHPADEQHLAPILDQVRVLERLADDLRTLALAESGSLSLAREPVDLAALIAETLDASRDAADRSGVSLQGDLPNDLDPVPLDPVRIRSVVANLITNAIRHTPSGGEVRVRVADEEGSVAAGGSVVFEVRDTGSGIPEAMQTRVFERFVRGPDSPGSGLGLSIARDLVSAQGGSIDLHSVEGQGTAVTVRLPRGTNDRDEATS